MDDLYRFARRRVRRYVSPEADNFHDLVQEGVIAGWRDQQRRSESWLETVMKNRIVNVVGGHPSFGAAEGRTYDQHRRPDRDDMPEDVPHAGDSYDQLETSILIEDALRALDYRDRRIAGYVALGLTWPEIGEQVGMGHHAVKKRWHSIVKPNLRDHLAA